MIVQNKEENKMRQKIKELRNKEEGFTLVELLAVIVILGIIVAIAIPAIGGILDRAGEQADDAEEQLILDAARLYDVDPETTWAEGTSVTVETLITEGFLDTRSNDENFGTGLSVSKGTNGNFELISTP